jgi:hypothetical protein
MTQSARDSLDKQIQSARDLLGQKISPEKHVMDIINNLDKDLNIKVSLPLRIHRAWSCDEKSGEDIVFVEVLCPSGEDMSSLGVEIIEQRSTVDDGVHKAVHMLVCHRDYKKLLALQKEHLGMFPSQPLDS